ncbi:MAG: Lrp/AsnC family transcriptional regulator [Eubacteriales bacterium]|nr:Lrp/AsnC family transcriptional regulator [Eubacteriales bacterium]
MRDKVLGDKILTILEKNARITAKDLAALIGEREEDVAKEIEALEDSGVICGYHTMVNWDKTDNEKADAFIEVKVAPQRGVGFEQIAERIWQYPEVTSVYLISGNFDYAVIIQGKSMREIAMFVSEKLSTIDGVLSTSTLFILKKYKDHGTVLEEPRKDERIEMS